MTWILSKADVTPASDWKLMLALIDLGIVAATGVLAFIPYRLARGRRHRRVQLVMAAALLWGAASAGLFIYAAGEQLTWSSEQTLLIESGYYDPRGTTNVPQWPWGGTIVVAAGYVAIVCGAMMCKGEPTA